MHKRYLDIAGYVYIAVACVAMSFTAAGNKTPVQNAVAVETEAETMNSADTETEADLSALSKPEGKEPAGAVTKTPAPEKKKDAGDSRRKRNGLKAEEEKPKDCMIYSNGRMQYADENGDIVKDSIVQISGNDYYFDKSGNLVTGFLNYGGHRMYANENGILQKGKWVDTSSGSYYFNKSGYMFTEGTTPDGFIVGKDGRYHGTWGGSSRSSVDRQALIWSLLKIGGATNKAAAGLMGCMHVYSAFDCQAQNGGYGLIQWNGSDRAALSSYAGARRMPESDITAQVNFIFSGPCADILRTDFPSAKAAAETWNARWREHCGIDISYSTLYTDQASEIYKRFTGADDDAADVSGTEAYAAETAEQAEIMETVVPTEPLPAENATPANAASMHSFIDP